MEEEKVNKPLPKEIAAKMYLSRGGRIAFNYAVVMFVITVFSILSEILPVMFVMFLGLLEVCALILTFGAVLAMAPNMFANLDTANETAIAFGKTFGWLWKIFAPLAFAAAAVAIVLFVLERDARHRGKIVASGVICAIGLVLVIIKLAAGV